MRFLLTTALLLCGIGAALRLSRAELAFRDDSASQVQASLRDLGSTPNAYYPERLADLIPGGETGFLVQALEANPRLTSARIALGLLEEQRGDFASAEQTLLQAAHFDRQYLPAWTLANFYFRRSNVDSFWQWARRAAPLNYDNPQPVLRLASLEEHDPAVVLARLQAGDNVLYAYLDLLIGSGRLDAAHALLPMLLRAKVVRKNQLLDLTTRQIQAGDVSWALKTWNALCAISPGCVSLDPEHGPLLSAGFETPAGLKSMDGEGFHVKPVPNPGITEAWNPEEARFSFDSPQLDLCPLFEQPVPAPRCGGKRYRLQYEYKSSATGAHWSMAGFDSPVLALQQVWQRGEWTIFPAPEVANRDTGRDNLRILKLRLIYRREPGTIPAQGELRLRNLQLTIF